MADDASEFQGNGTRLRTAQITASRTMYVGRHGATKRKGFKRLGYSVFIGAGVLIVLIVACGICVKLFVDAQYTKQIIYGLIGLILVVGIVAGIWIECIRRKAARKRPILLVTNRTKPTAPTSWDWRSSTRTTLPPYSDKGANGPAAPEEVQPLTDTIVK